MVGSLLAGNADIVDIIVAFLMRIPAVLIAISVHEAAHGYIAYKLGDPTAKLMGRVTINPLAHFDLFGAICMLIFGFGWANPVPFNLRMLKHPKRDTAFIAVAGPMSNLIVAFLTLGLYCALVYVAAFFFPDALMIDGSGIFSIFMQMLQIIVIINLNLMIFNLIPIPPLDGSKVLISLLPERGLRFMLKYERYGMPVLLIWLLIGDYLPWFLSLDYLLSWVVGKVYMLFANLWMPIFGFIFNLFA